jgi:serine/threonine protein kinase
MEFVGATWNLRPTTQLLSTPIAFHYHSTDTNNHLIVSRHMAAFRKATKSLKVYYESLEDDKNLETIPDPSATVIPPPTTIFPDRRNYKSYLANTQILFRYLGQLQEDKLVFSGIEDQGGRNICVKFVQAYSLSAHLHLAELGHAPAIRGYEVIAGGWIMVVMDTLSPREFRTLTKAREELLPLRLFDAILGALESLHEAGFVHGDIRDTNIMVSMNNQDFRIIDFDWAGTIGQARYPMNVNRGPGLWRPDDAVDRAPITTKHDIAMLDYIVTQYKKHHHGRLSL